MPNKPTKYDDVMKRLKNQPVIAIVLVVGAAIIAIGSLTNAISTIRDFLSPPEATVQPPDSAEAQRREAVVQSWIVDGEIEDRVRKDITFIAENWFPDDTGLTWSILNFSHKGFLTYVEVVPNSDTVGYERFVFVISFESTPADVIAVYAWEDGVYGLLATVKDLQVDLPTVLTDELQ